YAHLLAFGRALPRIRRRVRTDLGSEPASRQQLIAVAVRLLDRTGIRIGNDAYTRDNDSYGLTTLLRRHVAIQGPRLAFRYRGKSGQMRKVAIDDKRLSQIFVKCHQLPGYHLFDYYDDDGQCHCITSGDVN